MNVFIGRLDSNRLTRLLCSFIKNVKSINHHCTMYILFQDQIGRTHRRRSIGSRRTPQIFSIDSNRWIWWIKKPPISSIKLCQREKHNVNLLLLRLLCKQKTRQRAKAETKIPPPIILQYLKNRVQYRNPLLRACKFNLGYHYYYYQDEQ